MNYRELFSISVQHTYYQGGLGRDFSIVPTQDCLRLLQGHRLLYRQSPGRLRVLSPLEQGNMLIGLADQLQLRFSIVLQNPAPLQFTAAIPGQGQVFAYTNADQANAYTLNAATDSGAGKWGEVVLTNNSSLRTDFSQPNPFVIQLQAAQAAWTYYLILAEAEAPAAYQIQDTGGNLSFGAADDLSSSPDPQDATALQLTASSAMAGKRLLRFRSQQSLPYSENKLRGIQLIKQSSGNTFEVLIPDLPNPQAAKQGSAFIYL
ncbi:MAG: hypothetical protein D6730_24045 [Bacteroidetes bacterium]|nr:MAG: hypothetical protein D6730_24045 [Bacteroidota bacterium]